MQDVFLKLSRQDPAKVQDALKSWLYAVCRNRAFDLRKKECRMIAVDSEFLHSVECHEPGPAERAQQRETRAELLELVEQLPPNQREVIRLRFQGDLSYQEIAEVTQLSVGNVGFLLHTGLRKLRTMMTA